MTNLIADMDCRCAWPYFVAGAFLILLIMLILSIILFALLIKLKPRAPSKTEFCVTSVLRWNSTGIAVAGMVGNPGTAVNQLNDSLPMSYRTILLIISIIVFKSISMVVRVGRQYHDRFISIPIAKSSVYID